MESAENGVTKQLIYKKAVFVRGKDTLENRNTKLASGEATRAIRYRFRIHQMGHVWQVRKRVTAILPRLCFYRISNYKRETVASHTTGSMAYST